MVLPSPVCADGSAQHDCRVRTVVTPALGVSKLSSGTRVLNISNGYSLRFSRARRAIENCSAKWVEFGVSIRNLTLAESLEARNVQAQMREPLPYAEIHGLRFEPPVSGIEAKRREGKLLFDATQFAEAVAWEPGMVGV